MTQFHFIAIDTSIAHSLWDGGYDAYDQLPTIHTSDGDGIPCRHYLTLIPADQDYLCFALKPFVGTNPYTETGPAFLCAAPCDRATPSDAVPQVFASASYLRRGYSADERIVYGTGLVVPRDLIRARIAQLFENPRVAFVDLRSASNNCFQARAIRS